ncbi:MAG TPA: hypothetical protein VGJ32_16730 [Solirubrobacteraceae bacterium]|jgi:hypothetical protein
MLLPLATYALLLAAGGLAMSEAVSRRARLLLAAVGAAQAVLLVSWTLRAECLGAWCADGSGLLTWLLGPALLALAIGVAVVDGVKRRRPLDRR